MRYPTPYWPEIISADTTQIQATPMPTERPPEMPGSAPGTQRLFFNRDLTFGIYPTVGWDSGFGPNAGLHLVWRDAFGKEEGFGGKAVIGWWSRAIAQLQFTSGERFGRHVTLGAEVLFDRNPAERFFGIGNGDETEPRPGEPLINPTINNQAVETRFFERQAQAAGVLDIRPVDGFHIRPGGRIASVKMSNDIASNLSEPPIGDVYNTMDLIGFPDYNVGYGELELRLDTRRNANEFESRAIPSEGWLISVFVGRAFMNVGQNFNRYGGDVQKLLRLGVGPRALALRLHAEGVTGNLMTTPFTELPALGGAYVLRGYDWDRFRDRLAVVGSAEYGWDVSERLGASLFVDVGRVYHGPDELSWDNMRVGFGVGLQAHTARVLLTRVQLASSIDGGVFFNLAFEPAFEPQPRVRQR